MAEKVVVTRTMVDDLDGTEFDPAQEGAGENMKFGWRGKEYAIDLTAEHVAEFEQMMARYVEHARRVGTMAGHDGGSRRSSSSGGRRRGGGQGMGRSKEEIAAMRAWLREHGHEVADSGLVPRKLQEIYDRRDDPKIPGTAGESESASASARAPGKQPAFSSAKASPLDALIPPVSMPVRDSDNR